MDYIIQEIMGLFEIHCHTKEVSACGWVNAGDVVKIHKKEGFEGICITDHYYKGFFDRFPKQSNEYITDRYLAGYRIAKRMGDKIGLKVFLGMEIMFVENSNHYLVYGIDEKIIYDNACMYKMGLKEFSIFAKEKNMLLIQAHPFRDNMTMMNPEYLDGLEVVNGNPRHDSRNKMALNHADINSLIKIKGSDFHQECDINLAAMEFKCEIENNDELVKAIRETRF